MSRHTWGESFLKSGLPLEHVTLIALRSEGFLCYPNVEYSRQEESKEQTWFEIDMEATWHYTNKDTSLSLLVECKYHDQSRFWFFLPCERRRWHFNDRVFNFGPLQTQTHPLSETALNLAPLSCRGIVISRAGTKQENAVHTAVQQLANGFVPLTLSKMFRFRLHSKPGRAPGCTSLVPMIVTNAQIYRLRPALTNLSEIRDASSPADVGDLLPWTWCYFDPSRDLVSRNQKAIGQYREQYKRLFTRFKVVRDRLGLWATRPNWIAVVNIHHLREAVTAIGSHFLSLKTCKAATALRSTRGIRIE